MHCLTWCKRLSRSVTFIYISLTEAYIIGICSFCGCSVAVNSSEPGGLMVCGFMSWSTLRFNLPWFLFRNVSEDGATD